ncbi:MAG: hypothetical protein HFG80_11215 [Eubacterium sp.]|jgi:hypothetical protein|nr:hypothetical protein [Eubacterium sp.]
MIKANIDMEQDQAEVSAGFTDVNHFAQEMGMMIHTIINMTAYKGCGGDVKNGAKIAESLRDVVMQGLAMEMDFRSWVDQMGSGITTE